jgi:hypothetical protein
MALTDFQEGYILTRHWRDLGTHTEVEFWLSTHAGSPQLRLRPQPSVAFIPAGQQAEAGRVLKGEARVELRPLSLKDFRQRPVLGLYTQHDRQPVGLARRLARCDRLCDQRCESGRIPGTRGLRPFSLHVAIGAYIAADRRPRSSTFSTLSAGQQTAGTLACTNDS